MYNFPFQFSLVVFFKTASKMFECFINAVSVAPNVIIVVFVIVVVLTVAIVVVVVVIGF